MGKQSKTKSTQAAVTKDKDMECSRTTIENRLKEEAKYDDDKTEQLHALVDDMYCLERSWRIVKFIMTRHKVNNDIDNRCTYLPIKSIDGVPIQVEMMVKITYINPNNQSSSQIT